MFLLDGAMGTLLQKQGYLTPGHCPELSNIEHPEAIQAIHRSYIEAGSDFIQTNSFGANRIKLGEYDLSHRAREISLAAAANAKAACAGTAVKVLGDMGPTGKFIEPLGDIPFEDVYEAYAEQARALADGGADILLIQTIIDVQEMRAALLAAKTVAPAIPVMCEFTFNEDGRTITGTTPEAAAILLEALGADIIGANCSLGPSKLIPLIQRMAAVTSLPLVIQPNAGLPKLIDGETVFPLGPKEMAAYVQDMVDAGATYIGGCCGTSPTHLAAMRQALDTATATAKRPAPDKATYVTSRTAVVAIGSGKTPVIIGERINPTGRKALQKEIRNGNFVPVKTDAIRQAKAGAKLLDVNMGVPGIDQSIAMERAVREISMLVDTPLVIDSTDPVVLEKALRIYPGRALINSVNADPEQLTAILPIAKKYGAAVLCLPIGPGGIPKTAAERLNLVRSIYDTARKAGLRHEDLLADPLVLTAASDGSAPSETLRTLRAYKSELGIATIMGLSNVSFGLPGRPGLNAAFLSMALAAGLDAPIMNPLQTELMDAYRRSLLLLGHDEGARAYVNRFQDLPAAAQPQDTPAGTPLEQIRQAVRDGAKDSIGGLIHNALDAHLDPLVITSDGLTAAMTAIGDDYGQGRCYLPQVMMAAETMQAAFVTLKEALPSGFAMAEKGPFVIATVKGDVHDLGKNIVTALLENNGYKVIDLGKDVSADTIVQAVQESKAPLVGLSALMTTTMPQIDVTIAALKQAGSSAKVIVGGAVLTEEYAQQVGADAYADDATEAVRLANTFIGE
jgi:5-methyltetrahydrofolate--homocysteine methyltransferase